MRSGFAWFCLWMILILSTPLSAQPIDEAAVLRPKTSGSLRLHLRERKADDPKPIERDAEWNASETAILVCDMWDNLYCKQAAQRIRVMAPEMNKVLTEARRRGAQIIHCPSGVLDFYADTPFRRRMRLAPPVEPPVPIQAWCYLDPAHEGKLPIDDAKPCDDPVVGSMVKVFHRQHPAIDIVGFDGISDDGKEIYSYFRREGIKNVAIMGVHVNMCVMGRSFGIRQMVRLGMNTVVVRDMVDALYDPRQPPYVSQAKATELVVGHIERYWCPSIASRDLMSVIPGSDDPVPAAAPGFQRVPPTQPPQAESTFRTLDGFAMELIAAEPLVADPVAVEYDEDGRAWVAEMSDYPYTDKSTDQPFAERLTDLPLGKVRVLEDTDGDGEFDKSTLFADQLSWPTGLTFWRGGVFVAATPDLWYLKDTDGDGKADIRRKVYSGFRKFNVQAVINNLKWGMDHQIYGAGGSNGGSIRREGDPPNAKPVVLSRHDFRFDPRDERFEAIPGGERFGQTFNDWGDRFLCNIRNPLRHVVMEGLSRDVAEAGDALPIFRLSPPEPWRTERAKRWALESGQSYPRSELAGTGFVTSASGATIYRGDAYPAPYHGNAFIAEVSANLIHRRLVRPDGVTFASSRADEKTEFARSTDNWFRPVNFVNAPDGALHVVDMYRETIEHPWSIPDDIKAALDLESGRDRGRLYRLRPPGFRPRPAPKLSKATTAELIELLEHPNAWHRETAHRLLFERQDPAAVEPLRSKLRQGRTELARIHALWSLEGLGRCADADWAIAVKDAAPKVREQALRLAIARRSSDEAIAVVVALALADDDDVRVRFQLARLLNQRRTGGSALATVARRDAGNAEVRAAILQDAGGPQTSMAFNTLMTPDFAAKPEGLALLRELASALPANNSWDDDRLARLSEYARAEILLGASAGARQRGERGSAPARGIGPKEIASAIADLGTEAASADRRRQAAEILAFGSFKEVRTPLVQLLRPSQSPEAQLAAIRALTRFPDPQVAEILLRPLASLSPIARKEAIEALLARSERIGRLLTAIASGQVAASQIPPARRALLLKHADPVIRNLAIKLFSASALAPRRDVLDRYQAALKLKPKPGYGRRLLERECLVCHRFGGDGKDVGPDLETVRHRTPDELLVHILDPNREAAPNYLEYVIERQDGRIASGVIASESPQTVTLRRSEGIAESIPRGEIARMTTSGKSLMPEGLETKLTVQDIADLLSAIIGPSSP